MLTEVRETRAPDTDATPAHEMRTVWWVRAVSRLPLWMLYALSRVVGWVAFRILHYRRELVRENLARAFPQFTEQQLRATVRSYYYGFAEMLAEVLKSVTISPAQLSRRVHTVNLGTARELLARGQSVLLVAAHQCNWEWMVLALSLELGYPVDATYKPLGDPWSDREMKKLRARFGCRLVPAKQFFADIIRRHDVVRCLAMVADQEPTTSEFKHWTRFLNRDTAFYMGPEEISRATHFPAFFMGFRRLARGKYLMELTPLAAAGEVLAPGELTERYAHLVEAQIQAAPADWPWSHKRWKLKKPLYQRGARGQLTASGL
jgi:Kdo2-lipid IVA lauroyltransferase/acyltransferase